MDARASCPPPPSPPRKAAWDAMPGLPPLRAPRAGLRPARGRHRRAHPRLRLARRDLTARWNPPIPPGNSRKACASGPAPRRQDRPPSARFRPRGGSSAFRHAPISGAPRIDERGRKPMFENLSERLSGVFDRLTKQGALSEDDVRTAIARGARGAARGRRVAARSRATSSRRSRKKATGAAVTKIGHAGPAGHKDRP